MPIDRQRLAIARKLQLLRRSAGNFSIGTLKSYLGREFQGLTIARPDCLSDSLAAPRFGSGLAAIQIIGARSTHATPHAATTTTAARSRSFAGWRWAQGR